MLDQTKTDRPLAADREPFAKAQKRLHLQKHFAKGRPKSQREIDGLVEREFQLLFEAFLHKKYKLTIEEYDEMMLNQGGMCALCEGEGTLVVDHDHTTKKVRGLLCRCCNGALGFLKDSADTATKAAEYLKKHKTP